MHTFMKTQNLIETILKGSVCLGTFTLPELFSVIRADKVNGLAIAQDEEKMFCLAIINGEPEGAIYLDEKGELYGDKAVMLISDHEKFQLCDVKPDVVDAMVMGCRIFEKSHLRSSVPVALPEFGNKSQGLGVLTIIVQKDQEPQNVVRVSLRRAGKIVGSDITTDDGSVGFRVMYGDYDCIVQDRNQNITTFRTKFSEKNNKIIRDL
jgi:hypothetical protein